jgi:hypothetical protein
MSDDVAIASLPAKFGWRFVLASARHFQTFDSTRLTNFKRTQSRIELVDAIKKEVYGISLLSPAEHNQFYQI